MTKPVFMDILIKLIAKCDEKEEYFSFARAERVRFGASTPAGRKKVALEQDSRICQAVSPCPRYGSASARQKREFRWYHGAYFVLLLGLMYAFLIENGELRMEN